MFSIFMETRRLVLIGPVQALALLIWFLHVYPYRLCIQKLSSLALSYCNYWRDTEYVLNQLLQKNSWSEVCQLYSKQCNYETGEWLYLNYLLLYSYNWLYNNMNWNCLNSHTYLDFILAFHDTSIDIYVSTYTIFVIEFKTVNCGGFFTFNMPHVIA